MDKTEITKIVEKELLEFFDAKTLLRHNKEIMEFSIEATLKAINYTRCCETLKDKKKLNFKDWKFSKGIRYLSGHTYKDNDGDLYDSDELEKMYEHYRSL